MFFPFYNYLFVCLIILKIFSSASENKCCACVGVGGGGAWRQSTMTHASPLPPSPSWAVYCYFETRVEEGECFLHQQNYCLVIRRAAQNNFHFLLCLQYFKLASSNIGHFSAYLFSSLLPLLIIFIHLVASWAGFWGPLPGFGRNQPFFLMGQTANWGTLIA